jgi:hypothetical protein
MQKKIEDLEKLILLACQKITSLEEDNRLISTKFKAMSSKFGEFVKDGEKLNKLLNWKNKTHDRLKKLKNKLEHLINQTKK